MSKALTWIGGLLLVALAAMFAVPRVVDWNAYRGVFEEEASRMLGREVRVGGGVAVRMLPSPYVRFEQLRIADTSGTLGEPFFRAEGFTMGLSILPLMRGAIEATSVVVTKPVLTLSIDAQGRGNWRDFKLTPAAMPFMPADVSLQDVKIEDGTLTIRADGAGELIRLDAIAGQFSADSLEGPYKFRGETQWDGSVREVSISTARADADGNTRFKAHVRSAASGARYTLDGGAVDLATRPRLTAELTARLPFRSGDITDQKSAAGIDLKSKLYADTAGASLSDLTLSYDQGDQPQMVTGEALASWLSGTRIKVKLAAVWLDLDRLASGATGDLLDKAAAPRPGPARVVQTLVPQLVAALPRSATTEVSFAVDQVNIGGDVASNVGFTVARGTGPMELKALKASLPGGATLSLAGNFTYGPKGEAFAGTLDLHGTSFSRFLGWSMQRPAGIEQRSDGAFSMQGRIALDAAGIDIRDASSEVFGTPISGAFNYRWEGRRSARILLEGPRIDLSAFLPGSLERIAALDLLRPTAAAAPAAPSLATQSPATQTSATATAGKPPAGSASLIADLGDTDVGLRIRAGEVSDGRIVLRDVDADASLLDGKLSIARLGLTTAEGLRLDLEGNLTGLGDVPTGTLRGLAAAPSTTSLARLLAAAGLDTEHTRVTGQDSNPNRNLGRNQDRQLAGLVPLRLAGTMTLGARGRATELTLDGAVRGSRTRARMRLDGGLDGWRSAPVDLEMSFEDAATGLTFAQLVLDRTTRLAALDAASLGKGEVVIRAKGIPAKTMLALAAIRTPSLHLDYDGTVRLPADGLSELAGTARLAADRAAPLLTLAGLDGAGSLAGSPVSGQLTFSAKGNVLDVRPRGLLIAGTPVDGVIQLASGESGRQTIDANLTMARASVAALLGGVLERQRSARETAAATGIDARAAGTLATALRVTGSISGSDIWPDLPFSLAASDRLDGRIRLAVRALELDRGLTVTDAVLTSRIAPGKVSLESLTGRAAGGVLTAALTFEKAPAGAVVNGRLALEDARLESLAGPAAATGSASLDVKFSGRALTPRALMSVVTGSGEVRLVKATLAGLAPAVLDKIAAAVLDGSLPPTAEAIRPLLRQGLASGATALGSRRVGLEIGDGALRLSRLAFESPEARGSIDATLALATLALDSEWRIASKATLPTAEGKPAKPPLPGVTLIWTGPLAAIGAIEPRLGTDAYERELSVRKMERDVEELERLRKEDEERARAEAERRRVQDEARSAEAQRAAEAVAAQRGPAISAETLPPVSPPPATGEMRPAAGATNAMPTTDASRPPASPTPMLGAVVPVPPTTADAAPLAGAPPAARVTRKANPPPPSPFRPFDRDQTAN